jgi:nicotinamide-nucleotide amidase
MLKEKVVGGNIIHRTLLTAGIGESALAEHISAWEASLPGYLKVAYLPNYGMVRLRITGIGDDREKIERESDKYFQLLIALVKEWLVTSEDITLVQSVSKLLKERQQRMATAESCTGGYIAHQVTSLPGSSAIFNGAVVSYSNEVKTDVLNVNEHTLITFGAVSEQTVTEMVKGACISLNSDYSIATSGIMGPDGGTDEKPVGTVWVAVGTREKVETKKFNFRFDRMRNIEMTAVQAMNMLRKFILSND